MKLAEMDTRTVERWDRWFNRHKEEFILATEPYVGRPITYVEIGCWAGASAEWVATNLLTHPFSRGFGIDPYPPDRKRHDLEAIQERARERLMFMGERWEWMKVTSHEGLRWLHTRGTKIDLLYIDGSHHGPDVVLDFALAWPMLKQGSTVIFDDYRRTKSNKYPNVDAAVSACMQAWGALLMPVGKWDWQAAFCIKAKSFAELE